MCVCERLHERVCVCVCDITAIEVGTGKCRSTEEMSFVFFNTRYRLSLNRIQRLRIPTLTLRQGIALLCWPEATLSSFWDGTGFYIHCGAIEFSGTFQTIPQHLRNKKCMVISGFFVPFSASRFMLA